MKDTCNKVLKLKCSGKSNDLWEIRAFCDSDYAGDKETRKSVTGFLIYVDESLVSWKSHAQRCVTLSSSEAEYVAISEVSAEILFVKQVMEFFGLKIDYPIIVRVDNVGAIYLAENAATKHAQDMWIFAFILCKTTLKMEF